VTAKTSVTIKRVFKNYQKILLNKITQKQVRGNTHCVATRSDNFAS